MNRYSAVLKVEDVFTITGRGTVVTGTVDEGIFNKGDAVIVLKPDGSQREAFISCIEFSHKQLESVGAGNSCCLLLNRWEKKKTLFSEKAIIGTIPRSEFRRDDLIVKL